MVAGLRLIARIAGICLLGVVASIPASARTAPPRSHSVSALLHSVPRVYTRSGSAARSCRAIELTTPSDSITNRQSGRIFLEDTTSPSSDALNTLRVEVPMTPDRLPRAASPALRNSSASVSNRQRAP